MECQSSTTPSNTYKKTCERDEFAQLMERLTSFAEELAGVIFDHAGESMPYPADAAKSIVQLEVSTCRSFYYLLHQ